jgi:mxaD protein
MKKLAGLLACVLLLASHAAAVGAAPQYVEQKIAIAAPPQAVWAVIKDFGSLASWHPLTAGCDARGGNASGAERVVTFSEDGGLTERLEDYDAANMRYSYRLVTGNLHVLPVSFYMAAIAVKRGADGGSELEWSGRFLHGDTGKAPLENLDGAASLRAMTAFMRAGLEGVKLKAEGKGR